MPVSSLIEGLSQLSCDEKGSGGILPAVSSIHFGGKMPPLLRSTPAKSEYNAEGHWYNYPFGIFDGNDLHLAYDIWTPDQTERLLGYIRIQDF